MTLDLAEIFKPILIDCTVFRLLNKKELQAEDLDNKLNSCVLKESERNIFVKALEDRLQETIKIAFLRSTQL